MTIKYLYTVELEENGDINTGLSAVFNHLPIDYLEKMIQTVKNDLNNRLQERRDLIESSNND